jgi:hypothetical protein
VETHGRAMTVDEEADDALAQGEARARVAEA